MLLGSVTALHCAVLHGGQFLGQPERWGSMHAEPFRQSAVLKRAAAGLERLLGICEKVSAARESARESEASLVRGVQDRTKKRRKGGAEAAVEENGEREEEEEEEDEQGSVKGGQGVVPGGQECKDPRGGVRTHNGPQAGGKTEQRRQPEDVVATLGEQDSKEVRKRVRVRSNVDVKGDAQAKDVHSRSSRNGGVKMVRGPMGRWIGRAKEEGARKDKGRVRERRKERVGEGGDGGMTKELLGKWVRQGVPRQRRRPLASGFCRGTDLRPANTLTPPAVEMGRKVRTWKASQRGRWKGRGRGRGRVGCYRRGSVRQAGGIDRSCRSSFFAGSPRSTTAWCMTVPGSFLLASCHLAGPG